MSRLSGWIALCICIGLSACAGRKALPVEMPMTALRSESQWFVLSGVENLPESGRTFTTAIVMLSDQNGSPFVNVFASSIRGSHPFDHKTYRFSGKEVALSRKGQLLTFTLTSTDSAEVFFRISRDEAFFRITRRGETLASCQSEHLREKPLSLDTLGTVIPVVALRQSLPWDEFDARNMSVYAMRKGEDWLFSPSSKSGTTIWMDFQIDFGAHYFIMLEEDVVAGRYTYHGWKWDVAETPAAFNGKVSDPRKVFSSTHSKYDYPVGWDLTMPMDSSVIRVEAVSEQQEMELKRSSFWMGGVEIVRPGGAGTVDEYLGHGNMFIFRRQ